MNTIPRLIHQIWLGDKLPPTIMLQWHFSWVDLNPEWHCLWWSEGLKTSEGHWTLSTEGSGLPQLKIVANDWQTDLLKAACNLAQRANIWRYLILHQHGGVYLDFDLEALRPISRLFEGVTMATAQRRTPYLVRENAFMVSPPNTEWTRDLVKYLPLRDPGTSLSMGCDYLTWVTNRHPQVGLLSKGDVIFEPPADWEQAKLEAKEPGVVTSPETYPEAYAIHHWGSVWHKDGFKKIEP